MLSPNWAPASAGVVRREGAENVAGIRARALSGRPHPRQAMP